MDQTYQINILKKYINTLNGQINENNIHIAKLQLVQRNIIKNQEELASNQQLVEKPPLINDTWEGKYATEFSEYRRTIKSEFNDVIQVQIETLLENIETKIVQLSNINEDHYSSIVSHRKKITVLKHS